MGFKKYCENNNQNYSKEETEKIENLYNKYKDKNEDELLFELLNNVQKQKENGTFDFDAISQMIDKMKPFLTKEQIIKINDLLNKIN